MSSEVDGPVNLREIMNECVYVLISHIYAKLMNCVLMVMMQTDN